MRSSASACRAARISSTKESAKPFFISHPRQYLPERTDLTAHSQAHLNRIAQRLNQRPRETLGYRTPAAMLAAALR